MGVADPALPELDLQCDPALAALSAGEHCAVVGQYLRRHSPPVERGQEGVDHLRAQGDAAGLRRDVDPRVIVENVEDFDLAVVGEAPVGDVGLPAFVGLVGAERAPRRVGPFLRLRVTNPRRDKIRQIVEVAGTGSTPTVARCAAIVSAPASRPRFVRVLRSRTTWSSISRLTARGLPWGRRERGQYAASPSTSKRLTSFCTQTREIP